MIFITWRSDIFYSAIKIFIFSFLATFDKSMLQNKYSWTFSYFFLFYDKLIAFVILSHEYQQYIFLHYEFLIGLNF